MTDMTPETQGEAPKSHICFFRKKQMPLTDDRYDSRNTRRGPVESHLLFSGKSKCYSEMTGRSPETQPEAPGVTFAFYGKSKCHSQMTDMSPETVAEAPKVAFAFTRKSKCHSPMKDMTPETLAEAPRSHICFFRKKQMPLTDDRYDSINTLRGPQESHLLFPEKANATHR